jgi:Ion transport protein
VPRAGDYYESFGMQLDALIVCNSIIISAAETAKLSAVKALRVLRAVKPLRTLTHCSGMLLVLRSITMSLAAMAHVSLLVLMFFIIFGILGVQLFSGKFYRYAHLMVMLQNDTATSRL